MLSDSDRDCHTPCKPWAEAFHTLMAVPDSWRSTALHRCGRRQARACWRIKNCQKRACATAACPFVSGVCSVRRPRQGPPPPWLALLRQAVPRSSDGGSAVLLYVQRGGSHGVSRRCCARHCAVLCRGRLPSGRRALPHQLSAVPWSSRRDLQICSSDAGACGVGVTPQPLHAVGLCSRAPRHRVCCWPLGRASPAARLRQHWLGTPLRLQRRGAPNSKDLTEAAAAAGLQSWEREGGKAQKRLTAPRGLLPERKTTAEPTMALAMMQRAVRYRSSCRYSC